MENKSDFVLPVLMARQAIYNKSQDVVAYELLYRDDKGDFVAGLRDDEVTMSVLINSYGSISASDKVSKPLYIKVTDRILLNHDLPEFAKDTFTLEILSHTEISDDLLEVLKQLAKNGYRLALSGFDPGDKRLYPLLKIIHVLKLDVQLIGLERLPVLMEKLKPFNLELLADKVESQEEFKYCLEQGFCLYMGYFLGKPNLVRGRKITNNKMILLDVLRELQSKHSTAESVEQIALQDPELTYNFLRLVNSAAMNLRSEVKSLSHAISILGMEQVKRWVMLFLAKSNNSKPLDLTRTMLVRARMCELLAEMTQYPEVMDGFIVGLLSRLDAMMDIEMDALMQEVPIKVELKQAILSHSGDIGKILRDIEYYERGEFDKLSKLLPEKFYEVSYRHSLNWTSQIMDALT